MSDPQRFAGAAILYGTLPFDAGVPVTPGQLTGVPVFVAQGEQDRIIPRELLDRTWDHLGRGSGAAAALHRHPGEHGISEAAALALRDWILGLTQPA